MTNVLIIETVLVLANHLKNQFNKEKDINVLGIYDNDNDVINFLDGKDVNVILLDHYQTRGLVLTGQIKERFPEIKIIGYSSITKGDHAQRFLQFGGAVLLSKRVTSLERLINEITNYEK